MARIELMIGTSHGPLLSTPPEQWVQRVEADKARQHPFRGGVYSFDELVELRAAEGLEAKCALPRRIEHFLQCRAALATLRATWNRVQPDVAIIIGNDQREVFDQDNQPAFAISHADDFDNVPYSQLQLARLQPGLAIAEHGHHGDDKERYPGHPALAAHLTQELLEAGFDLATLARLPQLDHSYSSGLPHAYGFVYRQLMADHVVPTVPVFINTFYPPNQPTPGRCFDLGRSLAQALAGWPSDLKVAVIASGGMSHFVVDEELDQQFLRAIASGERQALLAIPRDRFSSGSSELKNWIPLAGLVSHDAGWSRAVEYVPCYRSVAGTGSGMAFAQWVSSNP